MFLVLLHSPKTHAPTWHFYELYSQPFPQKQVNMRNTESLCSLFYATSWLRRSCPVGPKMAAYWHTLTSHGKLRTSQSRKNFAANYSKKPSCLILTKIFGYYVKVPCHLDNSCKPPHTAPLQIDVTCASRRSAL